MEVGLLHAAEVALYHFNLGCGVGVVSSDILEKDAVRA